MYFNCTQKKYLLPTIQKIHTRLLKYKNYILARTEANNNYLIMLED